MPAPLSDRQQRIWQFIVEYVEEHGYPPTVREMGDHVGLASPSTVHGHLGAIERAGLIRRDPTKPRAIEIPGHRRGAAPAPVRDDIACLPLLGRVAAGSPLLAEENVEDTVAVPAALGAGADFLLTVQGDSMVGAGILDGDTLVVQSCDDARDGEIVVALAGDDEAADEATVKTFYREPDGRIRLQPENAALAPIFADHVRVLGRVVGVFRRL